MQKQAASTHLALDDENIYLLAGIVGLLLGVNPNTSEVNLGESPDHERAQVDCIKEAKLLDDGSCVMICTPVDGGISTDELCRDFTPHAGALADEFGRMVGFADLFAAGYEAAAVSPAHEAAFRTWLIDVSPAVAKFTADLAQTNRRLALAL